MHFKSLSKTSKGAFIVKGTKDYMYMHKILHPRDFEKWLHEL
jgi:hypothetical protein